MKQLANQKGVVLIAVLVAVVLMGLLAGLAGSSWKTLVQRAKEEELLWRGDQIRKAIGSYYNTTHGGAKGAYPQNLEALVRDPRFPDVVRHLRRLYVDPITGGDWTIIKDPSGRIKGVSSSSELLPFKQDNFSADDEDFANKQMYSDWQFIYEPKAEQKKSQKEPAESSEKGSAEQEKQKGPG